MKKINLIALIIGIMFLVAAQVSAEFQPKEISLAQANEILAGLGLKPFSFPISEGWIAHDMAGIPVKFNPRWVVVFTCADTGKNEKGEKIKFNFSETVRVFAYHNGEGKFYSPSQINEEILRGDAKPYIQKWQGKVEKSPKQEVDIEVTGRVFKVSRQEMKVEYWAGRYNRRVFYGLDLYLIEVQTPTDKLLLGISRTQEAGKPEEYQPADATPLLVNILTQLNAK